MKLIHNEAIEEVEKRFISRQHRIGMEKVMRDYSLVVAFRAAGQYTLEKLNHGAAAKPHSVLEKSIKPAELGLAGSFAELSLENFRKGEPEEELRTAKRFLCGLVGHRNERGKVTGVYLSGKGQFFFQDLGIILAENEGGAVYAPFETTGGLLMQIEDILAGNANPLSCAPYFVTGDYDLHEIQIVREDGRLTHVDADSNEEAQILQLLSLGCLGQYEGQKVDIPEFVPDEYSPIQHGAQDNYLMHMFLKERDRELVPKVIIPDPDLAVFNGLSGEWTVFSNSVESNRDYHEMLAIMEQVRALREYYRDLGGELPTHWQLDIEDVQARIIEFFNITPNAYEG